MTPAGPLAARFGAPSETSPSDVNGAPGWRFCIKEGGYALTADLPPQADRDGLARRIFDTLRSGRFSDLAAEDGRFAAIFSSPEEVILVRDPLGTRPLHFRIDERALEAATMPQDLMRGNETADWTWLARRATMQSRRSAKTAFHQIRRVPPGCLARWRRGEADAQIDRYWSPTLVPLDADFEAVVEQADALFRQAVRRALASAGSPVATQLSGGLDSSLIAAYASRQAEMLALTGTYTHAPIDPGANYFLDEAERAARTAQHLGIAHQTVVADDPALQDLIDTWQGALGEPVSNADNLSWLDPLYRAAKDSGAGRLLTGNSGNFTLSWPGSGALGELTKSGDIAALWQAARAQRRELGASWRGIAALMLQPWRKPVHEQNPFITGQDGDWALPRDRRAVRADILLGDDPGPWNEAVRRRYSIDEVDVFADRQLVEFSLLLRETHCYQPGQPRALIRALLRGKIDDATIDERKRGLQGADWPHRLAAAAPALLADLDAHPPPSPFNRDAMRGALQRFDPGLATTEKETALRFDLTRAFGAQRLGAMIGS